MNAPFNPTTPVTRRECSDCDGKGGWLATVTVSGEAMDADQREVICESCNGLGSTTCEPGCPCCEGGVVNGWCASCEEVVLLNLDVKQIEGRATLWL